MADPGATDNQLPDALIDELRRSDKAPEVITARVDRSLASLAQAHFADRRAPRWQRRGAWGAAAACVALVAVLATTRVAVDGDESIYADIDGSGSIDIADVLALARTGQGVPQAELDAFALRIVALDRVQRR